MIRIIQPQLLYKDGKFQKDMAVVIENGNIENVDLTEKITQKYSKIKIEVWNDMVMIPGTVNAHNHCFQSLLRGLEVGKPFLEWRDKALYKISPFLQPEDLYTGAIFAFGEMMKYGVTTVSDFFYVHNHGVQGDRAIIKAAQDVGIRLVLARTMYDWEGAPKGYVETVEQAVFTTKKLALEYNHLENKMVTILPAPHSLHAATPEMVKAGYKLAQELGTKFHIHVAEEPFEVDEILKKYKMRPVEFLDKLGVLDKSMVMIHAVWLNQQELSLMKNSGASLAYCPSSNMFLADGVTDIDWMQKKGINIGLGSDGACSNNRISVFEEMRMSSLLQKVNKLDALSINTEQAFSMGTINGGKILDLPIGEIKKGYKADFIGLDLKDISLQPLYESYEQLLANIVYAMQPSAIKNVIVNGKNTVENGSICTIGEDVIVTEVQKLMKKLSNTIT